MEKDFIRSGILNQCNVHKLGSICCCIHIVEFQILAIFVYSGNGTHGYQRIHVYFPAASFQ